MGQHQNPLYSESIGCIMVENANDEGYLIRVKGTADGVMMVSETKVNNDGEIGDLTLKTITGTATYTEAAVSFGVTSAEVLIKNSDAANDLYVRGNQTDNKFTLEPSDAIGFAAEMEEIYLSCGSGVTADYQLAVTYVA